MMIHKKDLPTGFGGEFSSHDCCNNFPGRALDGGVADLDHLKQEALLAGIIPLYGHVGLT